MRPRTIREGSVGLIILVGLGVFIGLVLWIRGLTLGNRSYKVVFDFVTVGGVQVGASVRYRGVTVGKVTKVNPSTNLVEVEAEISPADTIISKAVTVQVNPTGLLGDTSIDITPNRQVVGAIDGKPLDKDCNRSQIVCNNDHLPGQVGVSVDDVLKAAVRFTNLYGDPKLVGNANTLLKNAAEAAAEVAELSRRFQGLTRSAERQIAGFSTTSQAITQTADQARLTISNLDSFLNANRSTTVSTLDNINRITGQLRSAITRLEPTIGQLERSQLIRNLDTLSANAAEAAANFRDASRTLNNPANATTLQQTLDSARATFQNAQKITADLDELTGDPTFRANLKKLVNGLNSLVSSTQQLQQQAQVNQTLDTIATAAVQQAAQTPPTALPVVPVPVPAPTIVPEASPPSLGPAPIVSAPIVPTPIVPASTVPAPSETP